MLSAIVPTGTVKHGLDQPMLGMMMRPLIRRYCLVNDKYCVLAEVPTVKRTTIFEGLERLGIPRVLWGGALKQGRGASSAHVSGISGFQAPPG